MMERLRRSYQFPDTSPAHISTPYYTTSFFERLIWLTRQLALPHNPKK